MKDSVGKTWLKAAVVAGLVGAALSARKPTPPPPRADVVTVGETAPFAPLVTRPRVTQEDIAAAKHWLASPESQKDPALRQRVADKVKALEAAH